MNNNVEAPPQLGSFLGPLIITAAAIVGSCLALAAYHFILLRFCIASERAFQQHIAHAPPPPPPPPQDIPCGVDPEILEKIPILSYSSHHKGDACRLDQTECAICLGELEHGDKLRLLPSCTHAFHIICIDLWFAEHSNCPVCRLPLAITSASSVPVDSEDIDAQQVVSPRVPPLESDHEVTSDLSASGSTSQPPPALLQHSLSVAYHTEEKPKDLVMGLKRSLSLDQSSFISVVIQRDEEKASTSSSSSAATGIGIGIAQSKAKSLRQLDQVSSMLMTSFSQLLTNRNERSKGILPT